MDTRIAATSTLRAARYASLTTLVLAAFVSSASAQWTLRTTTPLVTQVDAPPNWFGCGAATARMDLLSANIAPNVTATPTLAALRIDIQANLGETGFYTTPSAEQFVLNKYTDKVNNPWILTRDAGNQQAAAAAKFAYAFSSYGAPASTLISRGDHWVTVTGIQTNVRPLGANNFTINWLEINDPAGAGRQYQRINYNIWTRDYQTASRWGENDKSKGKLNSVIYDPLRVVENFGILPDTPIRPLPGNKLTDTQAMLLAQSIVSADPSGFGTLQGKSALFAEEVVLNGSGDIAWNVGFGSSASQMFGSVVLDAYRGDMIAADWGDTSDFSDWNNRYDLFPYLGNRINTASSETLDRVGDAAQDFFYVTATGTAAPEPTTAALTVVGLFGLALRRRLA
jgi:hypothetical protein